MHVALLLPFLAISVLLIVIPGPDTAMVTKNALVGGRPLGRARLGWGRDRTDDLDGRCSARDRRAPARVLRRLRRAEDRGRRVPGMDRDRNAPLARSRGRELAARPANGWRALRQGLLSDLGNPKIAVFFTSLLPQFVHGDERAFVPLAFLGGVFAMLTLFWLAAYSLAVGHASGWLRRPSVRRALDRFTGVVLIAFGVRLALERR